MPDHPNVAQNYSIAPLNDPRMNRNPGKRDSRSSVIKDIIRSQRLNLEENRVETREIDKMADSVLHRSLDVAIRYYFPPKAT